MRSQENLGENEYNADAGVTISFPYTFEPLTAAAVNRSLDGTVITVEPAVSGQQYALFATGGEQLTEWKEPEDGAVVFTGLSPEDSFVVNTRIPANGEFPSMIQAAGITVAGIGGDVSGGDVSGGDVSGGDVSGGDVSGGDVSGGDVSGGDVDGGNVSGGDVSGGETSGGDLSGGQLRLASVFQSEGGLIPALAILGCFFIAVIDKLEALYKKKRQTDLK